MSILSKEEAKKIIDKVLSYSKADEMSVGLSGNQRGNIRYARNSVSTAGESEDLSLSVTAVFGKRSGTATVNEFDDETLKRTVKRAEEIARLAPENPEQMPMLGPQSYTDNPLTFEQATADITPEYRAKATLDSLELCKKADMTSAGFLMDSAGFSAQGNSKGMFAYDKSTNVNFSVTVRSQDGTGSGYASKDFNDVRKLDTAATTQVALQKAHASRNARAIEPGKYTVILEPLAASDLVSLLMRAMDARSADEGRSFLSKKGGGTRLGEKLFDERVNIYTDPSHPEIPKASFSNDGLPTGRTQWIENGVVKNMAYSRYWAKEKGVEPVASPFGFIMEGGNKSLADLIKGTQKGILVTRFWYIRSVDPQTLLFTGLTRDGTFFIEDGQIKFPVKNFRFNESPIIMLNNLEEMGRPERVSGSMLPSLKIRDFTFTSLSDAV